MSDDPEIPEGLRPPAGFQPYAEMSPFLDRIGPLYERAGAAGPVFGLRVEEHHCNRRGLVHGGLIAALADIALGKTGSRSRQPLASLLTASLTVDFVGSAGVGDWIEAECDFSRVGRRMAFGNCYITTGERRIARASGVFGVQGES